MLLLFADLILKFIPERKRQMRIKNDTEQKMRIMTRQMKEGAKSEVEKRNNHV